MWKRYPVTNIIYTYIYMHIYMRETERVFKSRTVRGDWGGGKEEDSDKGEQY
jgi:hypothetical protein